MEVADGVVSECDQLQSKKWQQTSINGRAIMNSGIVQGIAIVSNSSCYCDVACGKSVVESSGG